MLVRTLFLSKEYDRGRCRGSGICRCLSHHHHLGHQPEGRRASRRL